MKVFITGSSGYVGGMLLDRFFADPKVEKIIALDMKDPLPHAASYHSKVSFINWNLGDPGWEEKVLEDGAPDVVIHCAYVIREGYGKKRDWQLKSNVTAAERVFKFAFQNKIPHLIHFSTVASYGALAGNKVMQKFTEADPFREERYLYGVDKKVIEEKLKAMFQASGFKTQVLVVRPCAITGPRGQFMFKRFGLLQVVKYGLPIVPITGPQSARQYVHEDDIWKAIELMAKGGIKNSYEIFNIAPSDFLLLKDMAKEIGKVSVRVPMVLGKAVFALLWHGSQGRIPTVPTGINSYTYPIMVDGSKITNFGFKYQYTAREALKADRGYYTGFIHNGA